MFKHKVLVLSVVLVVVGIFSSEARSVDFMDILKTVAVGALVREASEPLNDFINTVTANKNSPAGVATKVVPILSIGEKGYIGAAQIVGSPELVQKTEVVFQYEAVFDGGKYRLKFLFPNSDIIPTHFDRVSGVGLSALIDTSIDGPAGSLESAGADTGDILRSAVIGAAITQIAEPVNSFINKIYSQKNAGTNYATKVVPRISVGERAYIGGVQVTGTPEAVSRVKAVFQYETQFSSGRYRIGIVIPGDSLNPLEFSRVKGVGVSAVIDTTVATDTHDAKQIAKGGKDPSHRSLNAAGDGFAGDADAWIEHAEGYIKQTKRDIDSIKKSEYRHDHDNDNNGDDDDDDDRHGQKGWKNKNKDKGDEQGKKHGNQNPSDANRRLADARKTLAQARHERAKGNDSGAINMAKEAIRIADDAKSRI